MPSKIYTIRIDERCRKNSLNLWYKEHVGEEFTANIAVVNDNGSDQAVFRLNTAPFFDVYLVDCTVVKELLIEN